MSDTNETLADILREMRNRADTIVNGRVITERNFVVQERVDEWADRLEKAYERQREEWEAKLIQESRIAREEAKAECRAKPLVRRNFDRFHGPNAIQAAFDAAVHGLNGWDAVADPVAEIRRMRDGDADPEPLSAPGNAAAMREALELIRAEMLKDSGFSLTTSFHAVIDELTQAALAAPARNFDRFTNTAMALGAYPFGPPIGDDWGDGDWMVFVDWLFSKAEGGAE